MKVRLISATSDGEQIMGYCARVSNPSNQDNPDYEKLLRYCIRNQHWSVFEMADMIVEITTSRAISAQILRHKSFSFQEFSQRYAQATECEIYEARRQDLKNRQNSIDDLSEEDKKWFLDAQTAILQFTSAFYKDALAKGIAKEQARFLLPASTQTKLYVKGSVRSWIHYLNLRCDISTQKEHREIAELCKIEFIKLFPTIAKALAWT